MDIVLHLLHITHSGQHHFDPVESCGKPEGVARIAAAGSGLSSQIIQSLLRLFRQVHEVSASDRFHDKDRFSMLAADFINLAALYGNVLVVKVVELYLNYLDFRILSEYTVQYSCLVMERQSHMADLSLRLEIECGLICAALLEELKVFCILRVHQQKVKVFNSACLKLRIDQRSDILFRLEVRVRKLVRQDVLAAVVP